ncbi:MAG: hypothetical protein LBP53_03980 [Candidatus Peribacteria bacterium]|jgi:hypothetical protein|nr:hypothetical protein [Candidatus Peribacteria bacterium]
MPVRCFGDITPPTITLSGDNPFPPPELWTMVDGSLRDVSRVAVGFGIMIGERVGTESLSVDTIKPTITLNGDPLIVLLQNATYNEL